MTAFAWTLAALCAISLLEVVLFAVRVPQLRTLARLSPPEPAHWPHVSVIVPARDEARDIGPALASRLADDYPDLEILVIDDRSTDGTGDVARAVAGADERVRVLRIDALPDGWLGKVHALQAGTEATSGEWLLFSDADVYMTPGALRHAIALAESDGLDMIALVPEYGAHSPLVVIAWTVFLRIIGVVLSPKAIRDPGSKQALGSGAFNLVRRSALDRTPGFEWLRLETGDDVSLAIMVKHHGGRLELMDGRGCACVDIYRDFGELLRGIEKNGGTSAAHPYRFTAGILAFLAVDWAPLMGVAVGLTAGLPWLAALSAITFASMTAINAYALRLNTGRWLPALAWPLGSGLLGWGLARSTWLVRMRGGVVWRGTFHPLDEIHESRRFEL